MSSKTIDDSQENSIVPGSVSTNVVAIDNSDHYGLSIDSLMNDEKNPFGEFSEDQIKQIDAMLSSDEVKHILQEADLTDIVKDDSKSVSTGVSGQKASTSGEESEDEKLLREVAVLASSMDHAYACPPKIDSQKLSPVELHDVGYSLSASNKIESQLLQTDLPVVTEMISQPSVNNEPKKISLVPSSLESDLALLDSPLDDAKLSSHPSSGKISVETDPSELCKSKLESAETEPDKAKLCKDPDESLEEKDHEIVVDKIMVSPGTNKSQTPRSRRSSRIGDNELKNQAEKVRQENLRLEKEALKASDKKEQEVAAEKNKKKKANTKATEAGKKKKVQEEESDSDEDIPLQNIKKGQVKKKGKKKSDTEASLSEDSDDSTPLKTASSADDSSSKGIRITPRRAREKPARFRDFEHPSIIKVGGTPKQETKQKKAAEKAEDSEGGQKKNKNTDVTQKQSPKKKGKEEPDSEDESPKKVKKGKKLKGKKLKTKGKVDEAESEEEGDGKKIKRGKKVKRLKVKKKNKKSSTEDEEEEDGEGEEEENTEDVSKLEKLKKAKGVKLKGKGKKKNEDEEEKSTSEVDEGKGKKVKKKKKGQLKKLKDQSDEKGQTKGQKEKKKGKVKKKVNKSESESQETVDSDEGEEDEEKEENDEDSFEDDEADDDWEPPDTSKELYCLCRKPYNNRFMICCDRCEMWYHGTCVGVSRKEAKIYESKKDYICPPCTEKEKPESEPSTPVKKKGIKKKEKETKNSPKKTGKAIPAEKPKALGKKRTKDVESETDSGKSPLKIVKPNKKKVTIEPKPVPVSPKTKSEGQKSILKKPERNVFDIEVTSSQSDEKNEDPTAYSPKDDAKTPEKKKPKQLVASMLAKLKQTNKNLDKAGLSNVKKKNLEKSPKICRGDNQMEVSDSSQTTKTESEDKNDSNISDPHHKDLEKEKCHQELVEKEKIVGTLKVVDPEHPKEKEETSKSPGPDRSKPEKQRKNSLTENIKSPLKKNRNRSLSGLTENIKSPLKKNRNRSLSGSKSDNEKQRKISDSEHKPISEIQKIRKTSESDVKTDDSVISQESSARTSISDSKSEQLETPQKEHRSRSESESSVKPDKTPTTEKKKKKHKIRKSLEVFEETLFSPAEAVHITEAKKRPSLEEADKPSSQSSAKRTFQECITTDCRKEARPGSVYCSNECIVKHAQESLTVLKLEREKTATKASESAKDQDAKVVSKKVVVLERKSGRILTGPNAPTEDILKDWLKEHPTFEVLKPSVKNTSAQHSSHKESENESKDQNKKSENVSDKKGTDPDPIRINVRKHIRDALIARAEAAYDIMLSNSEIKTLALDIEDELFKYYGATGSKYKNKYRSLVFNIKDTKNERLFRNILTRKTKPHKLVKMSNEQFANRELAQWREQETKHAIHMIEETEKEAVEDAKKQPHVKKTHKGEVNVTEDEDLSSLVEVVKPPSSTHEPAKIEPSADILGTMIVDSTDQHKKHLFDLNCKICTGKIAPPSDDPKPKKVKVSHSTSDKERKKKTDKEEETNKEKEKTLDKDIPNAEEVVMEVMKAIKKAKQDTEREKKEMQKDSVTVRSPDSALQSGLEKPKFTPTGPSLWKGFVFMQDLTKFVTTAYRVSGPTDSLHMPDTIHVCGRISPEQIWDYLSKLKQARTRDICVLRFLPGGDEEKQAYIQFYSYLNSRVRCGVVGSLSKAIKDMYIIPLASHSKIPSVLQPFDGPGLEENRPHMLLGVIVKQKLKRPIVTPSNQEEYVPVVSTSQAKKKKVTSSVPHTKSTSKVTSVLTPSSSSGEKQNTPQSIESQTPCSTESLVSESDNQDPIIKAFGRADSITPTGESQDSTPYSPSQYDSPYDPSQATTDVPTQVPTHKVTPSKIQPSAKKLTDSSSKTKAKIVELSKKMPVSQINITSMIDQISKNSSPADVTASVLAALATTSNLDDQKKLLAELTKRVEEQKKMLKLKKDSVNTTTPLGTTSVTSSTKPSESKSSVSLLSSLSSQSLSTLTSGTSDSSSSGTLSANVVTSSTNSFVPEKRSEVIVTSQSRSDDKPSSLSTSSAFTHTKTISTDSVETQVATGIKVITSSSEKPSSDLPLALKSLFDQMKPNVPKVVKDQSEQVPKASKETNSTDKVSDKDVPQTSIDSTEPKKEQTDNAVVNTTNESQEKCSTAKKTLSRFLSPKKNNETIPGLDDFKLPTHSSQSSDADEVFEKIVKKEEKKPMITFKIKGIQSSAETNKISSTSVSSSGSTGDQSEVTKPDLEDVDLRQKPSMDISTKDQPPLSTTLLDVDMRNKVEADSVSKSQNMTGIPSNMDMSQTTKGHQSDAPRVKGVQPLPPGVSPEEITDIPGAAPPVMPLPPRPQTWQVSVSSSSEDVDHRRSDKGTDLFTTEDQDSRKLKQKHPKEEKLLPPGVTPVPLPVDTEDKDFRRDSHWKPVISGESSESGKSSPLSWTESHWQGEPDPKRLKITEDKDERILPEMGPNSIPQRAENQKALTPPPLPLFLQTSTSSMNIATPPLPLQNVTLPNVLLPPNPPTQQQLSHPVQPQLSQHMPPQSNSPLIIPQTKSHDDIIQHNMPPHSMSGPSFPPSSLPHHVSTLHQTLPLHNIPPLNIPLPSMPPQSSVKIPRKIIPEDDFEDSDEIGFGDYIEKDKKGNSEKSSDNFDIKFPFGSEDQDQRFTSAVPSTSHSHVSERRPFRRGFGGRRFDGRGRGRGFGRGNNMGRGHSFSGMSRERDIEHAQASEFPQDKDYREGRGRGTPRENVERDHGGFRKGSNESQDYNRDKDDKKGERDDHRQSKDNRNERRDHREHDDHREYRDDRRDRDRRDEHKDSRDYRRDKDYRSRDDSRHHRDRRSHNSDRYSDRDRRRDSDRDRDRNRDRGRDRSRSEHSRHTGKGRDGAS